MIAKGCTCKNTFTIPFKQEEIETLFITYCQRKEIVLEKTLEDCVFDTDSIRVGLTQEETLMFCDCSSVQIQIRAKLTSGAAVKSNIVETTTDIVLKDGVI